MGSSDFHAINAQFYNQLSRQQIELFIAEAQANPQLRQEFNHGNLTTAEAISQIARINGYYFTAEQFSDFIETLLQSRLPVDELAQRKAWIKLHESRTDSQATESLEHILYDSTYTHSFSIDRQSILLGNAVVIRQLPALDTLLYLISDILRQYLKVSDLVSCHAFITHEELIKRSKDANSELLGDPRVPAIMENILLDLGIDPDQTLWEWPSFRIFFPSSLNSDGFYRGGTTSLLQPHRDTWYGSPQHTINFWGPLQPIAKDQTVQILPAYFYKAVKNSSSCRDLWLTRCGLGLTPQLHMEIDYSSSVAPPLNVGDLFVFAGHSLHASSLNYNLSTRLSFEFRILNEYDKNAGYAPPNLDYYGFGEIYTGWFNRIGSQTNYFSGLPLQSLE